MDSGSTSGPSGALPISNSCKSYVEVDENVAKKLFEKNIISDGMVVKVDNSLKALNKGVQKIHIISGEIKNALITELETEEGIGTVFQKNELEY